MSVGCQFVTRVLKQDHCSLAASSCLSLANMLPSVTTERFIAIESNVVGICSCYLPWGLTSASASWDWALALPGNSLQHCLPFIPDWPHVHVARALPHCFV